MVIRRGQLAQGPEVHAWEKELAAYLGVAGAVALANGTAGLHLSLLALGAGPGKNVVLPAYACVSLHNAVCYTGAATVLVDSLEQNPDMDLAAATQACTPETVAIVVPQLFGRCLPLAPQSVPVLEDATQSLGAGDSGMCAGAQGSAGIFSFYATKMLAGGEGGALSSDDPSLLAFAREHRDYDGREDWRLRFNYKMSELSAALLRVQLRKLSGFLERRRSIARFYSEQLRDLDEVSLKLPLQGPGDACYRYVLLARHADIPDRIEKLQALGVSARRPVYRPIHHYIAGAEHAFPNAEEYWSRALSIPVYPDLSDAEVEQVAAAVKDVFS